MKFKATKFLITWLNKAYILIFVMVTIGGVTCLTQFGLSIVEWKPLIGTFPPISHDSWQEKFELYKQFPEYQKLYLDMNLAEFKSNFFLEYLHRTIGHLIGLVFLIPLSFAVLHQAGSMTLFPLSPY